MILCCKGTRRWRVWVCFGIGCRARVSAFVVVVVMVCKRNVVGVREVPVMTVSAAAR